MAAVSVSLIKELRQQCGAGMSDCKKALQENDGELKAARDWLQVRGAAIAASKADREVAQGLITVLIEGNHGVLVETLAETDFVTSNQVFRAFSAQIAQAAFDADGDVLELSELKIKGESIEQLRADATLQIGENIQLGRCRVLHAQGKLTSYLHHDGKIGVLADIAGELNAEQRKQVCMHIAAAKPSNLTRDEFNQDELLRQRELFAATVAALGKSLLVQEKIIEGKLTKLIAEKTLLMQEYVWDDKLTVGEFLDQHKAQIHAFALLYIPSS